MFEIGRSMQPKLIKKALLATLFAACLAPSFVSAQEVLVPGTTSQGSLWKDAPAYPNTISENQPYGLQFRCYAVDTTPGSHWQIEVVSFGNAMRLAIGSGDSCYEARAAGWFHTALYSKGIFDPVTTLRVTAGGGRYFVSVTSGGFGDFKIKATETAGGSDHVVLPVGRKLLGKPPAGTASTFSSAIGSEHSSGKIVRDCDRCPEMVVLPGGSFMMGSNEFEENRSPSEGPLHRVTISRPFALGRYEVTFEEYDACVADGGCDAVADEGWGRGRRPVINVTYLHAQRYVSWLSETTGHAYFVPSEAEWEYAARAGSDTPWNTGTAIITADANFLQTFNKTVSTGSYPPNAFGLYDMHGNVWEWTQDCIDTGYLGVPVDGSAAASGDCVNRRILRGGGHTSAHDRVRSAAREGFPERTSNNTIGLRVARAL